MAKRLTDTEKWKDDWYLSLSNDYRIIWQYILDNCNHAGMWKKGFVFMNMCCHTEITEVDFKNVFKDRVVDCGSFYFLPKFIKFQYKNDLKSNKPVIVSVKNLLLENNLLSIIDESLLNDSTTIKSKSKDKSKSKSKEGGMGETRFDPKVCDLIKKTAKEFKKF